MSTPTDELLRAICLGNIEAEAFLIGWHRYCHLIDDIVDDAVDNHEAVRVARWANDLYSTPFYQKHAAALGPLVQLITLQYEDSVAWEGADQEWKRDVADTLRHCGTDMIRMVALIVGGYDHAKKFSNDIREICHAEHHDEEGRPT